MNFWYTVFLLVCLLVGLIAGGKLERRKFLKILLPEDWIRFVIKNTTSVHHFKGCLVVFTKRGKVTKIQFHHWK